MVMLLLEAHIPSRTLNRIVPTDRTPRPPRRQAAAVSGPALAPTSCYLREAVRGSKSTRERDRRGSGDGHRAHPRLYHRVRCQTRMDVQAQRRPILPGAEVAWFLKRGRVHCAPDLGGITGDGAARRGDGGDGACVVAISTVLADRTLCLPVETRSVS
jgi:hypothetical protein